MKKLNIYSVLLLSFCIISIIVFISGIRELVVLNDLKEQKEALKTISETNSLLKENITVLKSDRSNLHRIINTETKKEYRNLISEHKESKFTGKDNFQNILKNLNNNLKTEHSKNIETIQDLINDADKIYSGSYLPNYNKISEKKYQLIDIDNYFIEKIGSEQHLSKPELQNKLKTEIFDLSLQLTKSHNLVITKLQQAQLKTGTYYTEFNENLEKEYSRAQNLAFIFFVFVIFVLVSVLIFLLRMVPLPIKNIQEHLEIITAGELPENINLNAGSDINKIGETINRLVFGLKRLVDFSSEIGKANFDTDFRLLSDNDVLGTSLLTLRKNLQTAQEEEVKRKKEDAQRNRTNEGLTLFNEIMRQQSGSITELADVIISALVKFLNANQGGLFFLNEDDKENIHYELLGAYAYNRKKYISKKIKPGEGLVGAVAIEKYTVYMTDVPDEYIKIESGVGSANPRSILIVPLKIGENVLGIIELASFNEFEPYEIEMVEKVAESIASSMTNARINMQTSELLKRSRNQEKLISELEEDISSYIKEIKELTKRINTLERENKRKNKTPS